MDRICIEVRRRVERCQITTRPLTRKSVQVFYPNWNTDPYKKWATNFVRKNHWRVTTVFPEQEDALQECAAIFSHCANKYGYKVNNAKWFMSLYIQSVLNKFCRHSVKDSQYRDTIAVNYDLLGMNVDTSELPSDSDDGFDEDISYDASESNAPLCAAIAESSEEVKTLLVKLMNAPAPLVNQLFGRKPGMAFLPPPHKEKDKEIDARLRVTFGLVNPVPKPRRRQPPNLVEKLRDLLDCN